MIINAHTHAVWASTKMMKVTAIGVILAAWNAMVQHLKTVCLVPLTITSAIISAIKMSALMLLTYQFLKSVYARDASSDAPNVFLLNSANTASLAIRFTRVGAICNVQGIWFQLRLHSDMDREQFAPRAWGSTHLDAKVVIQSHATDARMDTTSIGTTISRIVTTERSNV
jgi:hypothetical protein